jgi:hypothetical protein
MKPTIEYTRQHPENQAPEPQCGYPVQGQTIGPSESVTPTAPRLGH